MLSSAAKAAAEALQPPGVEALLLPPYATAHAIQSAPEE